MSLRLVRRAEWGARPAKRRSSAVLNKPSTGHWNGPTLTVRGKTTWDHSICASLVRGIQNFHMDARDYSDIGYNFLVCPHRYLFEGRGTNTVNAANGTNPGNRSSHAIMWMAGEGNPFTEDEKRIFRDAVAFIAWVTEAPNEAQGHRDHKATACPGDDRYNWIKAGMPLSEETPKPAPAPKPPQKPATPHPTLRLGMQGTAVRQVQRIIHDKAGGNISVDGIFGPKTERRVKDVQTVFKIGADGIVGPRTWAALEFLATR